MQVTPPSAPPSAVPVPPHTRRPRYAGSNPRRFSERYKELSLDPETLLKVEASGKTAAGTHRPVALDECLAALALRPGDVAVDATFGHGGHAAAMLRCLAPHGSLLALDADGETLARTQARLRALSHGEDALTCVHSNYAALAAVLQQHHPGGVDAVLVDCGVSSMQLDDPARGMTMKRDGPLDMRLDRSKGRTAADVIAASSREALAALLVDGADEPHAEAVAAALAGRRLATTGGLASAVRAALPRSLSPAEAGLSVRRVFQALRVATNDELRRLDALLAALPRVLKPGGRAALLSFHSGEDRRVKAAFRAGLQAGVYSIVSDMIRPSLAEQRANPRAAPAKLRWAVRAADDAATGDGGTRQQNRGERE